MTLIAYWTQRLDVGFLIAIATYLFLAAVETKRATAIIFAKITDKDSDDY